MAVVTMEMKSAKLPLFALLLLALLLAGCATQRVAPVADAAAYAFAQAAPLARNDATLQGQAKAENALAIERLLSALDNASLAREAAKLPAGDALYDFAGKILLSRGLPLPRPFDSAERWHFGQRPPADRDGYRPPVKMAVLLPLSGSLAAAAAPVREGLLAGYYNETRRRPEMVFFDTAAAGGATGAYQKAVSANVDFVLGPLGRDEVSAVFAQGDLPVPVLALNRGTVAPPAGNAGFSLAPEDDGVIAAEYLFGIGKRNVLVVAGNDDNGSRAAQAFGERFRQRGGHVADALSVGDNPGDQAAALTDAAQKKADAVFLAVRGTAARLLAPQLALAGFADKPRVGTSQLASGTGNAKQDEALNGILFPGEVWVAHGVPGLAAPARVAADNPSVRGAAARLFAFGYDAWQLTAYLEKLAMSPNAEIRGATGTLKLDGFGNVSRKPAWSVFSQGRATPVSNGD
jgi:outer membrane PBP1 activator LpoA protein